MRRQKSTPDEKFTLLQVKFNSETARQLEESKELMGATTSVHVIRAGIRLTRLLLELLKDKDAEVVIRIRKGSKEEIREIVFL